MVLYKTSAGLRRELFERRMEWLMLWPLLIYAIILYAQPALFDLAPHYFYIRQTFTGAEWEVVLLIIAFFRLVSLVARLIWGWPFYALFALPASLLGFAIWLQFTLSFVVSAALFGTTPGPIAAHSTLVVAELMNITTSSRDVGGIIREWMNARRLQ